MTDPHTEHDLAQRLWELAGGAADPALERHLTGCATCREELDTLQTLHRFQATTGGDLADPPALLERSLIGLFGRVRPDLASSQSGVVERAREALRRITAELVFDSGLTPQLAGVRSAGDRASRQLAFVSEIADLDVEVTQQGDTNDVIGQLGMDAVPSGLVITFAPAEKGVAIVESPISSDGHFTVSLPAGEWVASVRFDDATLQFPGIVL